MAMRWTQREKALVRLLRKLQQAGAINRKDELKSLWGINEKSRRIQTMRYEQTQRRDQAWKRESKTSKTKNGK
jgi:hypothetical protein